MKEQKASVVHIPSTIVDLHLDFHGVAITVLKFDTKGIGELYLAVDKCGDVTIYQYTPEIDWKYDEFDAGANPDNAIDYGYTNVVGEIDTGTIQCDWSESVIKYTIAEDV
jgi:hypothetical protein